jgi:transglutaminase-like putative cysteine protease
MNEYAQRTPRHRSALLAALSLLLAAVPIALAGPEPYPIVEGPVARTVFDAWPAYLEPVGWPEGRTGASARRALAEASPQLESRLVLVEATLERSGAPDVIRARARRAAALVKDRLDRSQARPRRLLVEAHRNLRRRARTANDRERLLALRVPLEDSALTSADPSSLMPTALARAVRNDDPAPPSSEDLASTLDAPIDAELRHQAATLGNDPRRIYEWVRNNIEFTPTWGSTQGALLCWKTRSCNAFDTASLLVALLRAAEVPARWQWGTIEVDADDFRSWMGGFGDVDAAAALAASSGNPSVVRVADEQGNVRAVRLRHVWVSAWIDYFPSGGARHRQGDTWLALDAAFKLVRIEDPTIDTADAPSFDRDAYLGSGSELSPLEWYQEALTTWLAPNHPDATIEDLLTRRTIVATQAEVLPAAPAWRLVDCEPAQAELPDSLRAALQVEVRDAATGGALLSWQGWMPEQLDARLTLSYRPATTGDTEAATLFDGIYYTPPYLLDVVPVLRAGGIEVAAGASVGMAREVEIRISLHRPEAVAQVVANRSSAGTYTAIIAAPHRVDADRTVAPGEALRRADKRFGTLNIDNSDRDPWIGGGLHVLGTGYFQYLDSGAAFLESLYRARSVKTAHLALVHIEPRSERVADVPTSLTLPGVVIDADLLERVTLALDRAPAPIVEAERLRGLESSFHEHAIFEPGGRYDGAPAVSTVRALQAAVAEGQQLRLLDAANLQSEEADLEVGPVVLADIRRAVAAGRRVLVSPATVSLGDWTGVGYIEEDPVDGSAAYRITGGASGGYAPFDGPIGLAGGQVPDCSAPAQARNHGCSTGQPTAILAYSDACETGWDRFKCYVQGFFLDNAWYATGAVGNVLHGAGWRVVAGVVFGDDWAWIGEAGTRTDADVFQFIGHGGNGEVDVRVSYESDELIGFGSSALAVSRFRISNIGGCAAAGRCTVLQCQPDTALGNGWHAALSYKGPGVLTASVMHQYRVQKAQAWGEAKNFWGQLVSGLDVSGASVASTLGAIFGNPAAFLPPPSAPAQQGAAREDLR